MLSAATLVLAGCGVRPATPEIEPKAVIGRWAGADGAVVEFTAEHRVVATRYPFQVDVALVFHQPRDAEGSWQIRHGGAWEDTKVELALQVAGHQGLVATELYGESKNGSLRLFFWVGDPDADERFVFSKSP